MNTVFGCHNWNDGTKTSSFFRSLKMNGKETNSRGGMLKWSKLKGN